MFIDVLYCLHSSNTPVKCVVNFCEYLGNVYMINRVCVCVCVYIYRYIYKTGKCYNVVASWQPCCRSLHCSWPPCNVSTMLAPDWIAITEARLPSQRQTSCVCTCSLAPNEEWLGPRVRQRKEAGTCIATPLCCVPCTARLLKMPFHYVIILNTFCV